MLPYIGNSFACKSGRQLHYPPSSQVPLLTFSQASATLDWPLVTRLKPHDLPSLDQNKRLNYVCQALPTAASLDTAEQLCRL